MLVCEAQGLTKSGRIFHNNSRPAWPQFCSAKWTGQKLPDWQTQSFAIFHLIMRFTMKLFWFLSLPVLVCKGGGSRQQKKMVSIWESVPPRFIHWHDINVMSASKNIEFFAKNSNDEEFIIQWLDWHQNFWLFLQSDFQRFFKKLMMALFFQFLINIIHNFISINIWF